MKPMNQDFKWFLRELRRDELVKNTVILHLDEHRNFEIRGLRLVREAPSTDRVGQAGRIAVSCDELGLFWDFPVSSWTIDCKRSPYGAADKPFKAKIEISTPCGHTILLEGLSATAMGTPHRRPTTFRAAMQEIDRLNEELKDRDSKIKEKQKELDAARYEKLRVEGVISNLRGDLKRLLGL